jgi:hypothetical protein
MNWQVEVPWTVCSGCILHVYPWNSLPISLHIVMIHLGPSDDLDNSLNSAWAPVSGLIAVPLKWGEYWSGGSLSLVLFLGPSSGPPLEMLQGLCWCPSL